MVAEKVYETVQVFTPEIVSGVRYADSVGDYNPIHRSDSAARELGKKLGLEKAVAAGMSVVARAQGSDRIKSVRFKFKDIIYYGQEVAMQREVGGDGYRFIDNTDKSESPRVFYEGKIEEGRPSGNIISLPQSNLIYDENFHVSEKDVKNYLGAADKKTSLIRNPDLFLMSLPAAAMVNHAKKNKKGGLHTLQTMDVHRMWDTGDVQVSLFQKKFRLGSAFQKYQVYWSQKGLVVATGDAIVAPFDL